MSCTATGGLTGADCTGTLEINGVSMHTPAWKLLDLTALWLNPTLRGSNVLVPGTPGNRPYVRRVAETSVQLPGVIIGGVDKDGTPNTDVWEGLEANIDYLRENVLDPVGVGYAATLTMPSGSTRTALVQVVDMALAPGSAYYAGYLFNLDLVIPEGIFS